MEKWMRAAGSAGYKRAMKHHAFFLVAFLALVIAPQVRAEISPISVRVEVVSKDENEKFGKTQNKSLKVFVSNSSAQAMEGLTLKYYFFGRDVKDRDIVLLQKGEKAASAKAHGSEIVETPVVSAKSTEAHTVGGNFGKSSKTSYAKPAKKVEESGKKITGYGVQILDQEKVVAEFFSSPSLKEKLGAAVK